MGANLALNLADHGNRVTVYNRTSSVTDEFMAGEASEKDMVPAHSLEEMASTLASPRVVLLMVKAGAPVDWDRAATLLEHVHAQLDSGALGREQLVAAAPDLQALQAKAEAANQYSVLEIIGLILAALTGVGLLAVAGGLIYDAATTNSHEKTEALATNVLAKAKLPGSTALGGVGMEAEEGGSGAEMAQQASGAPGILGGHHGDLSQGVGGAGGEIPQVAERRGDDVQGASRHAPPPPGAFRRWP